MLDRIQKIIYQSYKPSDVVGCFLSLYDKKGILIGSEGSVQPQKSLEVLLPLLYNVITTDNTAEFAIVDCVKDMQEIVDKDELSSLDMSTHGICVLATGVSGVILPGTQGISSSKEALAAVKKKYSLTGKIRIFGFTTQRITVS